MTEQKIRAKALEIAVQTFALLPQDARMKFLSGDNNKIQQNIINTSQIFEEHIRGKISSHQREKLSLE